MKGRPENLGPEVEARPVILEIEGLTHYFDSLRAVHDFSVTIKEGELVGLIGPNGAGKTTVFNLITGVYRPTAGSIRYEGAPPDRPPFSRDYPDGHRPHISEHPPLRQPDRSG